MILQVTAAFIAIILTLWIRWRKKIINTFREIGIPGPTPNIVFGNMWEIYKKGPLKCHKEWIEKYGKLVGYYFGMRPVILVADPEMIKEVLIKDFPKFTDRANSLLRLDVIDEKLIINMASQRGRLWKETRSLLSPAFTSGKLKQMDQTISDAINLTMEIVEEKSSTGKEFDIYPIWQGLTADIIGRTAFGFDAGVQRNKEHVLLRSARVIASWHQLQSPFFLFGLSFKEFRSFFMFLQTVRLAFRNQMESPHKKLAEGLGEVIADRRKTKTKRPDLLQSLMDAEKTDDIRNMKFDKLTATDTNRTDEEQDQSKTLLAKKVLKKGQFLSDDEIKANAVMMYMAGYETTSTALAYTTYALVRNQNIQETLRKEVQNLYDQEGELSCHSVHRLPYMDQVISESLRKYPPLYSVVNREAVRETTVGKYTIPEGMALQVPVYWLHHNSQYWDKPEEFNPSRFADNSEAKSKLIWQPFGAGPRNCIGMALALMEAKLAIANILLKYRLEPSERTDKGDIQIRTTLAVLSPLNGVYLKAVAL